MKCIVYKLNELNQYKYVVILSKYQGKILLSRHEKRLTWETQGGHIEKGETPLEAAKRELFEESGAIKFSILPIFDYWAGDEESWANGMVFMADITELSQIPNSEMKEVQSFDELPDSLTYPEITPVIFDNAKEFF
jgi:8-oxo-dGTP diphosphatase